MNYKMLGRLISQILLVEAVFMLPALFISLHDRQWGASKAFAYTILIIAIVAGGMFAVCRNAQKKIYAREGLVCVGVSWIFMSVLGCLPFYFSGEIPHFIDALFEIVSGFTTTGASILSNVEALSRGIMYWRSFSHWIGGMGVLVFLLAVVPVAGQGSGFTMHLLRAESPGPNVGKLVPRMGQTAKILYMMYVLLTILNIVFLMFGGLPLFDSVCIGIGTAGTGGFGIKNDSIASYSPYIQNVCTVFMILFGVNFSCYYLLLIKEWKAVFKDEELRMYIGVILGSVAIISCNVRGMYATLEETVRHVFFQVASIITTTGFGTTDFDLWPSLSKSILLFLMVIGACAGSTGGGLKCGRFLLLAKSLKRNIRQVLDPQKVSVVRNNGQMVSEKVLDNTNAYLVAYAFIVLFSFVLVSLDGQSMETNVSAVIACFNNIGPGFDAVGATCNYSVFGTGTKLVLIMDMLAGRLEIFPILILLSRHTWKRR
ncbi:MAG: TrkH family potassium uptake protein [Eubacteriales bacterium]|nr:TrkH family potassium uptake protein [Eubacteriales bacterium]